MIPPAAKILAQIIVDRMRKKQWSEKLFSSFEKPRLHPRTLWRFFFALRTMERNRQKRFSLCPQRASLKELESRWRMFECFLFRGSNCGRGCILVRPLLINSTFNFSTILSNFKISNKLYDATLPASEKVCGSSHGPRLWLSYGLDNGHHTKIS